MDRLALFLNMPSCDGMGNGAWGPTSPGEGQGKGRGEEIELRRALDSYR